MVSSALAGAALLGVVAAGCGAARLGPARQLAASVAASVAAVRLCVSAGAELRAAEAATPWHPASAPRCDPPG